MDLYAYAQIPDLVHILEDNHIDIPRLRGLRVMCCEEPVPDAEIERSARKNYREAKRLDTPDRWWKPIHHFSRGRAVLYDPRQIRADARRSARRTRSQLEAYNSFIGR